MNVLFICTGNTCRSPMAQYLFNARAKNTHRAASCGFAAVPGDKINPHAKQALAEVGTDCEGFASTRFDVFCVDKFDKIFVFTPQAKQALCSVLSKQQADKVHLLGGGIADPFGGDMQTYRACRDQIDDAIGEILKHAN